MPRDNRYVIDAIDPVARELVCAHDDPRVCVSRVHAGLLGEVAPGAREALTVLAKLPAAPTRVHEDTTTYVPAAYPPRRDDVVLLRIEAGPDGHLADRDRVLAETVAAAFGSRGDCDHFAGPDEKLAAAYWLIGRAPVAPDGAVRLWQSLRQRADAEARVVALRRAALSCTVEDGQLSR